MNTDDWTDKKMKKRGIIIKNDLFAEIYGEKEIAEINRLIDVKCEPLTTAEVERNPEILRDCEIVMTEWGSVRFSEEVLSHAPRLEAVFYAGGSIKGLVSDGFWDRGIAISSAYGANAISVAQYTVSQIISCTKRMCQFSEQTRKIKDFPSRETFFMPGTYESVLGIVSLGMIGWQVCKYIQAITEMRIIAYDPFVSKDQARAMNVELCSLDDIFSQSDIVSLHTPVLEETIGMITGRHFRLMKRDSSFINTARGIIVREDEMFEVLRSRSDITAVLDVTHPEPPDSDSPLYELKNVILTPHIAGCMGPECKRMSKYMIDELERFINGKKLKWQITRERSLILA
jgi:phosphoglycerate dehydrogenase-like enzyme